MQYGSGKKQLNLDVDLDQGEGLFFSTFFNIARLGIIQYCHCFSRYYTCILIIFF